MFTARTRVVLVVDSAEEQRRNTVYVLEASGYRVLRADSAELAFMIFQRHDPPVDLVIARIELQRGISGIELIERLRQIKPALKYVLMSRYEEALLMVVPGFEEHLAHFIRSPVKRNALRNAVAGRLEVLGLAVAEAKA